MGMGTQTAYYKICTVTVVTGLYKALAMKVIVESQLGNFGNTANIETAEFNIAYYRSGGTQDDNDSVSIHGQNPLSHSLRAIKTGTGTYELQIKQDYSYRDALVKIQVISTNGGSIVMSDGLVTGSSGTEYTPATNANAENLFPGKVGAKRIQGASDAANTVPIFTFEGDEDTGVGYIGAGSVGFIANGSRKFYVNSTNAYFQNLTGGVDVPLLSIAGTTVISSSRNLTNIGTISSGKIEGITADANGHILKTDSSTASAGDVALQLRNSSSTYNLKFQNT